MDSAPGIYVVGWLFS